MMEQQMHPSEEAQVQQPGEQFGAGAPTQGGQQMGMRLQDVETPQQRMAIENITRTIQVCEWCADQCIQEADPNMIECIRLCEDVSELGRAALSLLPRNSRHTQTILNAFEQALQACGQECSQHPHAHCQECAQVLGQTTESLQQYFGSIGQQMGGQYGQQTGGQQMGGQYGQQTGGQQMGGFQ